MIQILKNSFMSKVGYVLPQGDCAYAYSEGCSSNLYRPYDPLVTDLSSGGIAPLVEYTSEVDKPVYTNGGGAVQPASTDLSMTTTTTPTEETPITEKKSMMPWLIGGGLLLLVLAKRKKR